MSIPVDVKLYKNNQHVKVHFANERLGIDRFDDYFRCTVSYGTRNVEDAMVSVLGHLKNVSGLDFDEVAVEFGGVTLIKNLKSGSYIKSFDPCRTLR